MDGDKQMAMLLQKQFDMEYSVHKPPKNLVYEDKKNKNQQNHNTSRSLIDPSWELVDPTPNVHVLFMAFNQRFFWNKLLAVAVNWSKRMTVCAGVCSYEGRGGECKISLSEPLLKLRPRKDLVETLLHEMIHAFLFVTHNNKDRDGHGPEFHKHMYRINKEAGTNITVYHDFHDEVRLYQQHVWRCDGPCQNRRPYFGFVRRSINRAPGRYDRWWDDHRATCGGTFTKISEPDKNRTKNKDTGKNKENKNKNAGDITKYVKVLGDKGKVTKTDNIKTISSIKNGVLGTANKNGTVVLNPKTDKSQKNKSETIIKPKSNIVTINDIDNNSNIIKPATPVKKTDDSPIDYSVVRNKWVTKFEDTNKQKSSDNSSRSKKPKTESGVSLIENVRNKWVNKFDDTNKRKSSDNSSSPKKMKTENGVILIENNVKCPVCDKEVANSKLNEHLDNCLLENNKPTEQKGINLHQCPSCDDFVDEKDINEHLDRCLNKHNQGSSNNEGNFKAKKDSDSITSKTSGSSRKNTKESFPVSSSTSSNTGSSRKSKDRNSTSSNVPGSSRNTKDAYPILSNTASSSKTNQYSDTTASTSNVRGSKVDKKDNLTLCEICNTFVSSDLYPVHVEKCLHKLYDEIDKKYNINSNTSTACLVCEKDILKTDLNEHLETCNGTAFDGSILEEFEDEEGDFSNEENKFNCPICMSLIAETKMTEHIDECLVKNMDFNDDFD